jgi:hypothetical protein
MAAEYAGKREQSAKNRRDILDWHEEEAYNLRTMLGEAGKKGYKPALLASLHNRIDRGELDSIDLPATEAEWLHLAHSLNGTDSSFVNRIDKAKDQALKEGRDPDEAELEAVKACEGTSAKSRANQAKATLACSEQFKKRKPRQALQAHSAKRMDNGSIGGQNRCERV